MRICFFGFPSVFGFRFVPAESKAKWIQFLNRGTEYAEFAGGEASAHFAYSAVVPGRLWFWLRRARISDLDWARSTLEYR